MSERWGDELEWCGKHGGYHLRNEDGGIAVITEIEDAQTLARLLNAARALAEAAREVIRSSDASDTWTSLIGILDEAQAAYRAARGEEA